MFSLPDPLHPAIVHFPIVLIFFGTLLSIFSVLTKRAALPQYTALVLVLAAASAQLAVMAGDDQEKQITRRAPETKSVIEEHAHWGELTSQVSMVAAGVALITLLFHRSKGLRKGLAFVTMLGAIGACYCVIEAADRGAGMVYHQGIGIQAETAKPSASPPATTATPQSAASPTGSTQ
jgi:uncharacterized membrane protein